MRFKWLKAFFLSCSLVILPNAHALSIGPIGPLALGESSTVPTVYVVSNAVASGGGFNLQTCATTPATQRCAVMSGYPQLSLSTNDGSVMTLAVTGFDGASTSSFIHIAAIGNSDDTYDASEVKDFTLRSANGASSSATNYFTVSNSTTRVDIQFSLRQQCEVHAVDGTCSGNEIAVPASGRPRGLVISLVATGDSTTPTQSAFATSGTKIRIVPQVEAPALSSCPGQGSYGETVFYPGDGGITFHANVLRARTGTIVGSSNFTNFQVAAGKASISSLTEATVIGNLGYQGGDQLMTGFENSTAEQTILYDAFLGVSDSAGAVRYCENKYTGLFASDIQGFLKDSNCFIATATYENSRHPVVLILREFRDHVLNSTSLGRLFVSAYYEYSPSMADFLIEHAWLRPLVKRLLMPVTVFAWLLLHPYWTIALLILFAGLLFAGRRAVLAGLALAFIFASPSTQASDQPYIDSLLSDLPPRAESSGSYTEELKKKLPNQNTGSYTEELRQELGEQKTAEGYTDSLKKKVGEKKGGNSAIADFQSNKKLVMNRGDMRIKTALSLKLATAMNRQYTAGANEDRPYKTVYGEGWQPDVQLTYEYRPFYVHSLLSGIGFLGGAGFTSVRGKGQFAYVSNFGNESNIRFSFLSVPVYVGPVLRLYLVDWFVPFVGAGAGALGFYETRSDRKPSARGYSWMYWMNGGVNIGLDWMSQRSTWERFDDSAVKHLYLTVEYQRFQTISGLVDATISGVNAGFLYEF